MLFIFGINFFASNKKSKDLFAKPTPDRCKIEIFDEFGMKECGGTIYEREDGSRFCGDELSKHPPNKGKPPP